MNYGGFLSSRTTTVQSDHAMNEVEAAGLLGLSVTTLRAWRHQGRGPRFVRFGRAVRYLTEDLGDYIDGCRVDTLRTTSATVGGDEETGRAS